MLEFSCSLSAVLLCKIFVRLCCCDEYYTSAAGKLLLILLELQLLLNPSGHMTCDHCTTGLAAVSVDWPNDEQYS